MPFLFDTNIFLEILLDQDKKSLAKKVLTDNIKEIFISDFSLHSIGIILLKQKKFVVFNAFLSDIVPHATILSLPKNKYTDLNVFSEKHSMDFDDSYQVLTAKEYNLDIITMDEDFKRAKDFIGVQFLWLSIADGRFSIFDGINRKSTFVLCHLSPDLLGKC